MSSVRALALGALMIVGVAGVSAAQSTTTPPSRGQRSGEMQGRRGGGGREFGRDLNLTDAQKAQIKAIHAKYQPQNEALRNQAKPFMEAAKAARQKGDTVAFRSNMEKARQVMQGGQSFRTQQNAEIRAILTPDQQVKFDARQKKMAERGKGDHKGWGKKKAPAAKS
jgi:Spy/CpxP family protein refolding chaperone